MCWAHVCLEWCTYRLPRNATQVRRQLAVSHSIVGCTGQVIFFERKLFVLQATTTTHAHTDPLSSQVVVDDQLPTGERGRLLCSASTDKTELWVSIIEKAYLKVTG